MPHLRHFLTHPHSHTTDTFRPTAKFPPSCRDPSSMAEDMWISHTVGRRCYKCTPLNSRCSMLHTLHTASRFLDFVFVGKGCHCMWNQSSPFSYVSLFPFRFRSSTPYSALTPFTAFFLQHRHVSLTLVVHAPTVAYLTIFQQVFSVLDAVLLVIVVLLPHPPALPVYSSRL
jgi:hypothetical protein